MIKYVPVQTIIAKLNRDIGGEDFSEDSLVEWSMEALEAIDAYIPRDVGFYVGTIENSSLKLPDEVDNIIQIVRVSEKSNQCEIIEEPIEEDCDLGCDLGCNLECGAFESESFIDPDDHTFVEYWKDKTEDLIKVFTAARMDLGYFEPLTKASHTFFNQENYYNKNQYILTTNGEIKFSFEKGPILIAHYINPKDENGIPMIVDNYYFITAITKYITMKMMEKYWYNGREGYGDKVQKAERDWYLFRDGARADLSMLKSIGDLERFNKETVHLLMGNKFKSFFNS